MARGSEQPRGDGDGAEGEGMEMRMSGAATGTRECIELAKLFQSRESGLESCYEWVEEGFSRFQI